MKLWRSPLGKFLIVTGSVLAVLAVALALMLSLADTSSKGQMEKFLALKQTYLQQAVRDAEGRNVKREDADTGALKLMFDFPALEVLDGRSSDGSARLYFQGAFSGVETFIDLHYLPDDEYIPPEDQDWTLVSSTENAWRWEGGGMLGRGYIDVERLKPNWFYMEMYYPT